MSKNRPIVARIRTFGNVDIPVHDLPVYRTYRDMGVANKWITKQVETGYWRIVNDMSIFGMYLAAKNGDCLLFTE